MTVIVGIIGKLYKESGTQKMIATTISLILTKIAICLVKNNLFGDLLWEIDFNQHLETILKSELLNYLIVYTRRKPLVPGEFQKIIGVHWICK